MQPFFDPESGKEYSKHFYSQPFPIASGMLRFKGLGEQHMI